MTFAAIVVFGYLLGSCPWGYWLVKLFRGEDIREIGSGNIGISNVWRHYGRTLGIPLVLLDVGKGFVPAWLGVAYVSHLGGVIAGAAAMVGHWRPIFIGFSKGGKMVATAGGALFAVAPLVGASAVGLWLVVFLLFGYASLSSLATAVFVPFAAWFFGYPLSVIAFCALAGVGVAFLHKGNVSRLIHRTEHRSRVAVLARLRPQRL